MEREVGIYFKTFLGKLSCIDFRMYIKGDKMKDNSLKKKTIEGFIWRFAERCGAQVVQFVVSIVLARILSPSDYGTLALIAVFTNILGVFVQSGMGAALVQKKDADDLDYSTLFYFNVVMCLSLYLLMFFVAPFIAKFYTKPELTIYTRVVSLTLIVSGVRGIQSAYVSKNMLFKRFFFSTLGGTILSAIVGITMAYKGFGVWALIAQELTNVTVDTIILWLTVKWRPKKMFSFTRLKGLFSYGWKLLASGLLDTGYLQLRNLLIGKVYSSSDLAYYSKAQSFPQLFVANVNSSIDSVLLPSMASVQESKETVKGMTRRALKTSTFIMAPLLMGLAACGKSIISILLTDKWLPSYPFMIVFCISNLFLPISTANLNAIKALGRSDVFFKLEIIKKTIGVLIIIATFRISVMAIALGGILSTIFNQFINTWPNKKLMNYSYREQIQDILPSLLLSMIMFVVVYSINFLSLNNWITLIIQVPLGAIIYIGLAIIFKFEAFTYCLDLVKAFFKNKR